LGMGFGFPPPGRGSSGGPKKNRGKKSVKKGSKKNPTFGRTIRGRGAAGPPPLPQGSGGGHLKKSLLKGCGIGEGGVLLQREKRCKNTVFVWNCKRSPDMADIHQIIWCWVLKKTEMPQYFLWRRPVKLLKCSPVYICKHLPTSPPPRGGCHLETAVRQGSLTTSWGVATSQGGGPQTETKPGGNVKKSSERLTASTLFLR